MTTFAPTQAITRSTLRIDNWQQMFCFISLVLIEGLWLAPLLHRVLSSVFLDNILAMPLENMIGFVLTNMLIGLVVRRTLVFFRIAYKHHRYYFLPILLLSISINIALLPLLMDKNGEINLNVGAAFATDTEIVANGYLLTPLVILTFLRGAIIGRYLPPPVAIGISSRLAIGMFFLTAIAAQPAEQDDMAVLMPFFFLVILAANSLGRSSSLKVANTVQQVRFSQRWFGMMVSTLIGTVLIGMLFAALLGGMNEEQVRRAFEIPFTIFVGLIVLLLSPFAYVIAWMVGQVPAPVDEPEPATPETGTREVVQSADNPQIDIGDEIRAFFDTATDVALWVVLIFIAALVIFFWVSVFLRPEDLELEDGSESIGDREHIKVNLFGKPLQNLRKALRGLGQGMGGNLFGVLTIRWAYSRMERMARKRGFPRDKAQTPLEYRAVLAKAFPDGEAQIRTITNAYVAIRYGELPELESQLEEVRQALDTLKSISAPATP